MDTLNFWYGNLQHLKSLPSGDPAILEYYEEIKSNSVLVQAYAKYFLVEENDEVIDLFGYLRLWEVIERESEVTDSIPTSGRLFEQALITANFNFLSTHKPRDDIDIFKIDNWRKWKICLDQNIVINIIYNFFPENVEKLAMLDHFYDGDDLNIQIIKNVRKPEHLFWILLNFNILNIRKIGLIIPNSDTDLKKAIVGGWRNASQFISRRQDVDFIFVVIGNEVNLLKRDIHLFKFQRYEILPGDNIYITSISQNDLFPFVSSYQQRILHRDILRGEDRFNSRFGQRAVINSGEDSSSDEEEILPIPTQMETYETNPLSGGRGIITLPPMINPQTGESTPGQRMIIGNIREETRETIREIPIRPTRQEAKTFFSNFGKNSIFQKITDGRNKDAVSFEIIGEGFPYFKCVNNHNFFIDSITGWCKEEPGNCGICPLCRQVLNTKIYINFDKKEEEKVREVAREVAREQVREEIEEEVEEFDYDEYERSSTGVD